MIASEYKEVNIIGDITNYKKWKSAGCSFNITLNNESLQCKAWEKKGLQALCESENFKSLKLLSLSGNRLDDPAAELICHSRAFPELKTLDLYNNKISDHAVDQLRNSPNFPKLTALQVDWRI